MFSLKNSTLVLRFIALHVTPTKDATNLEISSSHTDPPLYCANLHSSVLNLQQCSLVLSTQDSPFSIDPSPTDQTAPTAISLISCHVHHIHNHLTSFCSFDNTDHLALYAGKSALATASFTVIGLSISSVLLHTTSGLSFSLRQNVHSPSQSLSTQISNSHFSNITSMSPSFQQRRDLKQIMYGCNISETQNYLYGGILMDFNYGSGLHYVNNSHTDNSSSPHIQPNYNTRFTYKDLEYDGTLKRYYWWKYTEQYPAGPEIDYETAEQSDYIHFARCTWRNIEYSSMTNTHGGVIGIWNAECDVLIEKCVFDTVHIVIDTENDLEAWSACIGFMYYKMYSPCSLTIKNNQFTNCLAETTGAVGNFQYCPYFVFSGNLVSDCASFESNSVISLVDTLVMIISNTIFENNQGIAANSIVMFNKYYYEADEYTFEPLTLHIDSCQFIGGKNNFDINVECLWTPGSPRFTNCFTTNDIAIGFENNDDPEWVMSAEFGPNIRSIDATTLTRDPSQVVLRISGLIPSTSLVHRFVFSSPEFSDVSVDIQITSSSIIHILNDTDKLKFTPNTEYALKSVTPLNLDSSGEPAWFWRLGPYDPISENDIPARFLFPEPPNPVVSEVRLEKASVINDLFKFVVVGKHFRVGWEGHLAIQDVGDVAITTVSLTEAVSSDFGISESSNLKPNKEYLVTGVVFGESRLETDFTPTQLTTPATPTTTTFLTTHNGSKDTTACGQSSAPCNSIAVAYTSATSQHETVDRVILKVITQTTIGEQFSLGSGTLFVKSANGAPPKVTFGDVLSNSPGSSSNGPSTGVITLSGGTLCLIHLTLAFPSLDVVSGDSQISCIIGTGLFEADKVTIKEESASWGVGVSLVGLSAGSVRLTRMKASGLSLKSSLPFISVESTSAKSSLIEESLFSNIKLNAPLIQQFSTTGQNALVVNRCSFVSCKLNSTNTTSPPSLVTFDSSSSTLLVSQSIFENSATYSSTDAITSGPLFVSFSSQPVTSQSISFSFIDSLLIDCVTPSNSSFGGITLHVSDNPTTISFDGSWFESTSASGIPFQHDEDNLPILAPKRKVSHPSSSAGNAVIIKRKTLLPKVRRTKSVFSGCHLRMRQ